MILKLPRELFQKMLISARKKDETLKLMVRTIVRTNEMNVYIFEMQAIGESLFTLFASLTYAYHYLMTLMK